MALTERERSYETLIRHNEDGSVGAHHQTISEVMRDGVVISATLNEPQQLAVLDGETGQKLADVLGAATTAALADAQRSAASLSAAQGVIQELTAKLASAESECESLRAALSEAQQTAVVSQAE